MIKFQHKNVLKFKDKIGLIGIQRLDKEMLKCATHSCSKNWQTTLKQKPAFAISEIVT